MGEWGGEIRKGKAVVVHTTGALGRSFRKPWVI